MPDWLLVVLGLAAGLALICGVLWVCFGLENRPGKRKSRLAEPSGNWDNGPSVGGGPDP